MNSAMQNPVGRPRSFDEEEVLATVMDVFWRQGYDGTSMADILAATGLHKGSIYQTFGDKHSLYIRALQAYVANMRLTMKGIVSGAESAIEGLRSAMHFHIELGSREGGENCGCLALNSLVELAQDDSDVMDVLETANGFRMQLMTETVARAQADGRLRKDWQPERIANLIAATEAGILVELRGPLNEDGAKAMIDDALTALS
jgi:TetR/AcrR family transcriptional repressor of nem operon